MLELDLFVDGQNPNLSSPRIFATHIPYALLPQSIKDSECKIIYMCGNVKDNFASLWYSTNKLRPKKRAKNTLDEAYDKFCRGVRPYGPCWDHVLGYWKASLEMQNRVLFLKYEDMKKRPVENVKKLVEFIGCPFHEGEALNEILRICSFESLSKLEVNKKGKLQTGMENNAFFRKGEVGDWMNLLSTEMAGKLDRITEEKLGATCLKL